MTTKTVRIAADTLREIRRRVKMAQAQEVKITIQEWIENACKKELKSEEKTAGVQEKLRA